jgi:predicted ATP-binding protein involved in virulence
MYLESTTQAESRFKSMQQENANKIKRIRQISVTNLFGIFNHTIPLKMDDRITIIHGPNGFGKTAMLKLLHALFSQDNRLLQAIPFDEFQVDFEDSTSFRVSKTARSSQSVESEIVFHANGKQPYLYKTNPITQSLQAAIQSLELANSRARYIRFGADNEEYSLTDLLNNRLLINYTDELAQRIDLLMTIINNRFLYKNMTIDKEKGLVFTSKNGTFLPPECLSSGEQHELVLFYELLFAVPPGELILIDEPEISLHVVWQEHFLEDVQQITKLIGIDIILATHSPDIVSHRRDLVVELEAPEDVILALE